jgi:hypothetical protein
MEYLLEHNPIRSDDPYIAINTNNLIVIYNVNIKKTIIEEKRRNG